MARKVEMERQHAAKVEMGRRHAAKVEMERRRQARKAEIECKSAMELFPLGTVVSWEIETVNSSDCSPLSDYFIYGVCVGQMDDDSQPSAVFLPLGKESTQVTVILRGRVRVASIRQFLVYDYVRKNTARLRPTGDVRLDKLIDMFGFVAHRKHLDNIRLVLPPTSVPYRHIPIVSLEDATPDLADPFYVACRERAIAYLDSLATVKKARWSWPLPDFDPFDGIMEGVHEPSPSNPRYYQWAWF